MKGSPVWFVALFLFISAIPGKFPLLGKIAGAAPNGPAQISAFGKNFQHSIFDRSHDIFFPAQFREKISIQQKFPVFWWNFIVIQPGTKVPGWDGLHRFCKRFKKDASGFLTAAECDQELADFGRVVGDWARDLPRREARPQDAQIKRSLESALAQASLPGGDAGLLSILREDPLGSWRELKRAAEEKSPIHLERVNGFFFDPATGRTIIPWQANFEPNDTRSMLKLRQVIQGAFDQSFSAGASTFTLIGPHPAPLQNEEQVQHDSDRVSIVGILILLLGSAALIFSGRGRLLWVVPPVLAAVALSAGLTVLVFGSIHGLTLSFGTAIIGLALDYGINGALNTSNRRIWRTNTVGLLTTLAGLVVLMASSIPLLQQMMFFAASGLVIAFAAYYVLITRMPGRFGVPVLFAPPRPGKLKVAAVIALLVCSVVGGARLRPDLSMAQFDFRDAASRESMAWLFKRLDLRSPLFRVHDASLGSERVLDEAHQERQWAEKNGVAIENVANYLPRASEQRSNLATWTRAGCTGFENGLKSEQRVFFKPFLDNFPCGVAAPGVLPESAAYLNHLKSGDQWVSLFLPKSDAQEALVRAQYPDASSVREVVSSFPSILERELAWMAPLSLLIVLLVHFVHYRNVRLSLLAVLPFFTGMGMVATAIWTFGYPFSFVSVMAALIVFGFSLDYGIFATDACVGMGRSRGKSGAVTRGAASGTWTAVPLSAFATVSGFAPLLFCRHPVLQHLGQTLFFGGLGTYVGAVWGIPWLAPFIGESGAKEPRRAAARAKTTPRVFIYARWLGLVLLLGVTWVFNDYHLSVFIPPAGVQNHEDPRLVAARVGKWKDKSELGIHQLVVRGNPLERGLAEGWLTRGLIYLQEKELIAQLDRIIPPWIRRPAEPLVFRWFWGLDRYLEPWMTREIYGVSESTSHEFDYLGDRFTRQVQYHDLHEVGQLMIDQVGDSVGCTVIALPRNGRWVIGRNFDFEGGRIFDTEKVMKWVFPDHGHAFVSVVWSGMVGAVTAVNDHGVYISLNAAGSTDFRRLGLPSTLVLLKAVQFADTAEQAVDIIRREQMFITDIFVVSDPTTGKLFRVEKSPRATEVIPLQGPSVVTNHLIAPRWQDDRINVFRRDELTSRVRAERGEELVNALYESQPKDPAQGVLEILRDKGEANGRPLHLGNRRAIDALIAAHAVIYDQPRGELYVSRGPGVSGELVGFDLKASFGRGEPVVIRRLPRDPRVSDERFEQVRLSAHLSHEAERFAAHDHCEQASARLAQAEQAYGEAYWYYAARGDIENRCGHDLTAARADWLKALSLAPAYPSEARALIQKLGQKADRKLGAMR